MVHLFQGTLRSAVTSNSDFLVGVIASGLQEASATTTAHFI